ncbi:fucolectin-like [Saccostrea echinata]|uniref:fucolectin-like n=1 Tax=Saccostrea echinata TaxID=191078 RepID=UPI002A82417A|nr:fucolectin-like [Saccostrea echinata]
MVIVFLMPGIKEQPIVYCTRKKLKFNYQLTGTTTILEVRQCSSELGNGVLDVNKVFIPGTSLNGSCNEGHFVCSVLTDIAVGKPSIQSPTFNIDQASNAVDGDRGTDIITNTCSHTDTGDDSPWWRVDLTDIYYITTVRILNRGMDMFGIDESARLRDVTISTGITTLNISSFCGFYAGPGVLSQLVTINCLPYTMGRYVQISLVTPYLTLCEVDVFVVEV